MHYSKEEKTKWLEDWRKSGKGAWAYAKAHSLNPQTFTKWTKAASKMNFVEVPVRIAQQSQHDGHQILIEKGDVKIHIPLSVGNSGLQAVMEGLGAALW